MDETQILGRLYGLAGIRIDSLELDRSLRERGLDYGLREFIKEFGIQEYNKGYRGRDREGPRTLVDTNDTFCG
jgi:hypothetical protein